MGKFSPVANLQVTHEYPQTASSVSILIELSTIPLLSEMDSMIMFMLYCFNEMGNFWYDEFFRHIKQLLQIKFSVSIVMVLEIPDLIMSYSEIEPLIIMIYYLWDYKIMEK